MESSITIFVDPMQNEIGSAHGGRVAYLNGFTRLSDLRRTTTKKGSRQKGSEFIQQFEILSKKLEINPETYLKNHSLTPFSFAYLCRRHVRYSNYQEAVANFLKPADGPLMKKMRFCASCTRNDSSFAGFCWWRREHQIPGIDVCVHHSEPLYNVDDTRAAEKLPSYYIRGGTYFEDTKPGHRHAIVERYRKNAIFFLSESIDSLYLDRRVKQRCKELGIVIRAKVDASHSLSRFVRSQFPVDWLRKHHASLANDTYGGRDLDIDSAFLGQGASGCTITMIVTSLFESVDDILCETHAPQVPRALPLYVQDSTTVEGDPMKSASAFVKHYLLARGATRRAAVTIGCSRTTVVSLRRRFGIPKFRFYPCTTSVEAARRLLSATDEDLRVWGLAMNQYWKMTHAKPSMKTDLEKFLIISSPS